MNFEFSEEQNLLREQARRFLAEHCPMSKVRAALEGDPSQDAQLWRKVAELGWPAAAIPEAFGGLGLSYLELAVIAEQLGRCLAPIPFSSSVYLATEALLLAGSEAQKAKWLPKLAAGEAIGTFALAEGMGRPRPEDLRTEARGATLTGTKAAVPDGEIAHLAVVVCRAGQGDGASWQLAELDGPGVSRAPQRTLDFSRGHARLQFQGAACEPLGAPGEGWALTWKLFERAAVLFAWEQIGGAEAALEMARGYALERYAFGRPIGSYQAIKHKLAHAYANNTLARSNGYFGAWALAADAPELPAAAATARISATHAYQYASKENIQTHGGMGFTWEFDCQFFYRRAKLLSLNIGSAALWKDRLITALERSNIA